MSRPALAFLIGTVGFVAYIVAVTMLGDFFVGAHWILQALYYGVAGILWVYPAVKLMYWGAGK